MHDAGGEPQLLMFALAREARRNKGIDVCDGCLQQAEVSPPLRRTLIGQTTEETMRSQTGSPVETEQGMGRADQPVVMQGVELDGVAVGQGFGAEQRDIVIMDHIKARADNLPNARGLEQREARLVAGQRRKGAPGALEPMNRDVGMVPVALCRQGRAESIGVKTVDDFHLVPAPRQFVRQALHHDAVAAEIIGRIEGGDHAKAQGAVHAPQKSGRLTERVLW